MVVKLVFHGREANESLFEDLFFLTLHPYKRNIARKRLEATNPISTDDKGIVINPYYTKEGFEVCGNKK